MKSVLYLLLFSVSYVGSVFSQDIAFYADVMVTASAPSHRDYAAKEFQKLFLADLEEENSFSNQYEDLEWISIQYPDDRSFRTLTWQYEKQDGGYKYGGLSLIHI